MHSLSWTTRVIFRMLRSNFSTLSGSPTNSNVKVRSATKRAYLVSVVCGFPKNFLNAKYKRGKFGEDSWFKTSTINADVVGVADGVGGWANYGIDPGEFSSFLMKTCERLVHCGNFNPRRPVNLLANSYWELLEQKTPILGSSTACVVVLNRENSTVYTANIGDSGFIVVREGQIIHKSEEQQHCFNTPFQLSLPPPGLGHNVLSDSPDSADTLSFTVKKGDVILVATDGVFDNVPDGILLDVLKDCQGVTDPIKLQMTANTLAITARSISFDNEFMSPFSINAGRNNITTKGGKPDDITLVLTTVALRN